MQFWWDYRSENTTKYMTLSIDCQWHIKYLQRYYWNITDTIGNKKYHKILYDRVTINSPLTWFKSLRSIRHKNIKCDMLVLCSQWSAIDNIILIFRGAVVVKLLYCPLTPAEGGNELWMALVIYGPIILKMPTSSLCWWSCLGPDLPGSELVQDSQLTSMPMCCTLKLTLHSKETQAAHTHTHKCTREDIGNF